MICGVASAMACYSGASTTVDQETCAVSSSCIPSLAYGGDLTTCHSCESLHQIASVIF